MSAADTHSTPVSLADTSWPLWTTAMCCFKGPICLTRITHWPRWLTSWPAEALSKIHGFCSGPEVGRDLFRINSDQLSFAVAKYVTDLTDGNDGRGHPRP